MVEAQDLARDAVHTEQPYPHRNACQGCLNAQICAVCGKDWGHGHCMNGRCGACHQKHCTPGIDHGHGPELRTDG